MHLIIWLSIKDQIVWKLPKIQEMLTIYRKNVK